MKWIVTFKLQSKSFKFVCIKLFDLDKKCSFKSFFLKLNNFKKDANCKLVLNCDDNLFKFYHNKNKSMKWNKRFEKIILLFHLNQYRLIVSINLKSQFPNSTNSLNQSNSYNFHILACLSKAMNRLVHEYTFMKLNINNWHLNKL